jgi:radical SAM superfamily enzyme YgiQ (UPF0313 family)
MYLSSSLKHAGHKVTLLQVENSADLVAQLAAVATTDILAFSVTTGLHKCYIAMGRLAKQRFNVMTVFGGSHATFFPEMIEEDGVDAVCIGEGEEAMVELADSLERGADISTISNWWLKIGGEVHKNPVRPPKQNLDELPYPDWELYYENNPVLRKMTVRPILASRGCPQSCSYCFNRSLNAIYKGYGNPVRTRRPAAVIEEILKIISLYKTSLVWFLDSNVGMNKEWFRELFGRYRREIKLPFYCKIRPDFVTSETADILARSGCTGVGIGIETGNERLRNEVLGRGMSRNDIVTACHLLKQRNIRIMSFNMIGLPGETVDDVFDTMRLNTECDVDYAMTMIMQPYPRTEIADYAIRNGYFDGDFERLDYDYYSTSVFTFPNEADRHKIENIQRLFAVAVEFPFIQRLLPAVAGWPKNNFYLNLFKLWHYYCFRKRFYGFSLFA